MRFRSLSVTLSVLVLLTSPTISAASTLDSFDPAGTGSGYPPEADGCENGKPCLRACALNGDPIRMDGRLDDVAWTHADAARGFKVWDPNRGADPSEQTVFKVAYDDEALYIGVACLEQDPAHITTQLCRRDRMTGSDQISLYVDPMHDLNTAYNFRVNPSGAQEDRYVYNDGYMDTSWDGVWQVETSRDAHGWYAEFRIPFSCIRYRHSDNMTWGFQLYRYMHGRGEDTAWVVWDAETQGFVSRFGELTEIRHVHPRRQLEIVPYFVQQTTDPAALSEEDHLEHIQNLGADLKMAVTSDLTLNATFQPDFGQVEADPAVLNLSPFETWYEEKRPFFLEGIQFYQHPNFGMFYSRRIGTGSENSRIRAAAKLTGKTSGGVSIAGLYAVTDVTETGQAHNFLKSGEQQTHYLLGRVSKEFSEGRHRIGFMQSAVYKPEDRDRFGEYETRDAWTSGMDFDTNFLDRRLNIMGSMVGSIIDPAPSRSDPSLNDAKSYGTGGNFNIRKFGGRIQGGVGGRWKTDRLDLNDIGYLESADEYFGGAWLNVRKVPNAENDGLLVEGGAEIEAWQDWLYAGGKGFDVDTGERVWSYGKGQIAPLFGQWNCWGRLRNYWNFWAGYNWWPTGVDRYSSEDYEGHRGPPVTKPGHAEVWGGFSTDSRRAFQLILDSNRWWSTTTDRGIWLRTEADWKAAHTMQYSLAVAYKRGHEEDQHIDNLANPGAGIGGVSWIFGELDQTTVDVTLRGSLLFSRKLSLELYAQPYLSVGDYRNARELARPNSYEWRPYAAADFDVDDYDFRYSSVNVNAVLRWEYRPGSALYLVWKQGRSIDQNRGSAADAGHSFSNTLSADNLLRAEPENVILAKVSYWFAM